jgi:hypothetical protein
MTYCREALDILEEKNPSLFVALNLGEYRPKEKEPDLYYVFGASLLAYKLFLPWLDEQEGREIVIIDDNMTYFSELFEKEESCLLLKDPRVRCFAIQNEVDYQNLAWHSPLKRWQLVALREEGDTKAKIESAKREVELLLVDYQNLGLDHIQNALLNLKRGFINHLSQLKGILKGSPGLICGGGASLEENSEIIRECSKGAYVFAGGRGVQKLLKMGIEIDFVGAIDPTNNYPEFECNPKLVFYQDRASHELLARGSASQIFCGAAFGYDLLHWIYRELNIDFTFDPGWDVSNFLFAIANYLGCSPIILAGQDHCYRTIEEAGNQNMPLKKMPDGTYSKDDFILACKWFEENMQEKVYKIGEGHPINLPYLNKKNHFDLVKTPIDVMPVLEEFKQSCSGFPLKEEICYTHFLKPLWDIFKYVYPEKYEMAFYKDALIKASKLYV